MELVSKDPIRDAVAHLEAAKACLDRVPKAPIANMDLLAKAHIVAAIAVLEVAAATEARTAEKKAAAAGAG